MRLHRIEHHDLLALVAGFLQQRLGLFDIGLEFDRLFDRKLALIAQLGVGPGRALPFR